MPIIALTHDNFDQIVDAHPIVVIDFWADWCAPCKAFETIYEEVAKDYSDICFTKVNIEEQTELAADFQVRSIPLVMILKERVAVFSESGAMPGEQLRDLLNQAKKLDIKEVKQQLNEEER